MNSRHNVDKELAGRDMLLSEKVTEHGNAY